MSEISNAPRVPREPLSSAEIDTRSLWQYMRDLSIFLSNELRRRMAEDSAGYQFFLFSPNRAVWQVTISDTGVLTTAKVKDPE